MATRNANSAISRYEARVLEYERAGRPERHASPRPARAPAFRTPDRPPPARRSRPEPGRAAPSRARARAGARSTPLAVRGRRIIMLAALLLLLDACVSFATMMMKTSNVPFSIRSVEWLRDNGAAWLVSDVERLFYSLNAPSTGGAALKALPTVGVAAAPGASKYLPPAVAPVITPALAGEGAWRRTGPVVAGGPPILVTTFRPDPLYPDMVAGVAWIDRTRAWMQLYPGRYEPASGPGGRPAQVPAALRGHLLAVFNSGFKLQDSGGGFVAFGHTYAPLHTGMATFIRLRDGTADVRSWSGGPAPGPEVEFARQNLPLIVEGGQLNPNLSNGALWGATLGNAVRVWRSGVGVDSKGNILYAAADNQTASSLAQIFQHAGAVRAMELDINYEWTTFNFFGAWNGASPGKLLPSMSRDSTRYLSPDDRDFFAVYARNGG